MTIITQQLGSQKEIEDTLGFLNFFNQFASTKDKKNKDFKTYSQNILIVVFRSSALCAKNRSVDYTEYYRFFTRLFESLKDKKKKRGETFNITTIVSHAPPQNQSLFPSLIFLLHLSDCYRPS